MRPPWWTQDTWEAYSRWLAEMFEQGKDARPAEFVAWWDGFVALLVFDMERLAHKNEAGVMDDPAMQAKLDTLLEITKPTPYILGQLPELLQWVGGLGEEASNELFLTLWRVASCAWTWSDWCNNAVLKAKPGRSSDVLAAVRLDAIMEADRRNRQKRGVR